VFSSSSSRDIEEADVFDRRQQTMKNEIRVEMLGDNSKKSANT
jgi:hypothetical protein